MGGGKVAGSPGWGQEATGGGQLHRWPGWHPGTRQRSLRKVRKHRLAGQEFSREE